MSVIAMAVILVTYMVTVGRSFSPSAKMMIEREKARMLARSGVEIAMSQLSVPDNVEKAAGEKKEQKEQQQETLFSFVLPRLNMWQQFPLTTVKDGISGEIGICLMSEEGKININAFFDPATGGLIKDFKENKQVEQAITLFFERAQKATGGKDMRKAFETFFKNRQTKLDDVTELLTIKEFEVFKDRLFYEPPEKAKKEEARTLYLTDIFTIWPESPQLQPWLLSDSVRGILDLSRVKAGSQQEIQKIVIDIIKTKPEELTFPDGWNKYLKVLYGKDFATLPKGIESLLETKFEPKIFSVISYGKVGKMTQKVFAIVERTKASSEKDKKQLIVKLKKLYWL